MHVSVAGRFNDGPDDFIRLFRIVRSALDSSGDLVFDLRRCMWLSTNAIVLLGGAARAVQADNRRVSFEWPQSERVYRLLGKCDFRVAFGGEPHRWVDNSGRFGTMNCSNSGTWLLI